jgi:hypothetical protein
VKELVYWGIGRITKEVWAKAEDRSEIPPIIIDFDDDQFYQF